MTVKGGNLSAAIWSAINAGLYSFIVILIATADLPMLGKIVITVIANLIGVYGVKLIEEKMRKNKLWKIEMTVRNESTDALRVRLNLAGIPNHYFTAGKHTVFNCFCDTKEQTKIALDAGAAFGAKCFANETTLAP